jgi:general secretion pathway protein H
VRARGFTLLELMVVLALLGMAYALVPPLFATGVSGVELKGAARQLASGLRKARSHAISTRQEAVLTVDVQRHTFRLTGDNRTYPLPARVQLSVYTAKSEVPAESLGSIRFYPDGSSTGGRVTVASEKRKFRVDVDWLMGRVTVAEL